MFGPRQVGEIIVGNAVATETTVKSFIDSASDKEVKVLGADGLAVKAGQPFYLLQKTAGDAAKGLGFEFSDMINPKYIDKITVKAYAPEVLGKYTVSGFAGAIAPKRTYSVAIRVENQLSPENFETIHGYYVTGEVIGSDTAATVIEGIVKSLNVSLKHRGNSEFTVASAADTITIEAKYQDNIPGKKDGRPLIFTVQAKVYDNVNNGYNSDLGLLTVVETVKPFIGNGTGKWATEYEYFVSGYKYDPNRLYAYPVNFETPYYTSKNAKYNVIQIVYFSPRTETIVERQYKVLTIVVDAGADGKVITATNAVLADIRTAVGAHTVVPANLTAVAG